MKKMIILFIVLGMCLVFLPKAVADLNDGLVAYYPFNGNADDESGNGNHGTVVGASLTADRHGIDNRAYSFDGLDDYIDCGDDPDFYFGTNDFSIVAWVKTSADIIGWGLGRDDIVGKGDATISGYFLSIRNNKAVFFIGNNTELDGINEINDGFWHLIIGIRKSNQANLYIDGELNTTGSNGESVDNLEKLIICKHGTMNESYFNGEVDDVRIYNRALSTSEIQQLSPPVAEFTANPTSGLHPLIVNFSDQSEGDITSWSWDFGDGLGTSTDQNPTYVYNNTGLYTVTLTVADTEGTDTETKIDYIKVDVPVADFDADPKGGFVPLNVSFTDESTGNITSWSWDFGDGVGSSNQQNPSYLYNSTGTYTISLTVTGPAGQDTEVKANFITVSQSSTSPRITNVELHKSSDLFNPKTSFVIGEQVTTYIYVTDPDLDVKEISVSQFHPSDSEIPYYGPDVFLLPNQMETDVIYYSESTIGGPAGDWRIEFQITDSSENKSNIFAVYVDVTKRKGGGGDGGGGGCLISTAAKGLVLQSK